MMSHPYPHLTKGVRAMSWVLRPVTDEETRSAPGLDESAEKTNTAHPASPPVAESARRPYLIIIAGTQVGQLHKIVKPRTVVGRSPSADIRIVDDGISREHVEILLEGNGISIRDLGSTNGTYRNGARVAADEITDGDKISLGSTTILKFSYQDGIDEAYEQRFYRSALLDGLTKALKREFFLERLEGEVAFSVRHASPLTLILWDLDHFKAVNDQHGHPVGDLILAATAQAITHVIRREDVFGRYGGEEFALSCRATPSGSALRTAERLREAIERTVVNVASASVRVTASFGVATCPSEGISTLSELVAAADSSMYGAKRSGRNRVEIAGFRPGGKSRTPL
jgi:two-component system cell cycle response regulator